MGLVFVSIQQACVFCFMYLGNPILGTYMLMSVISSSCIYPFIIIQCSSLSFFMAFVLKSVLSGVLLPPLSCYFHLYEISFFHPLTFNLCVSFALKWVSCRQYIVGSCFFIQSASLCLLIEALSPLTFKVIFNTDTVLLIIRDATGNKI